MHKTIVAIGLISVLIGQVNGAIASSNDRKCPNHHPDCRDRNRVALVTLEQE
jgi:hypothetical protein